MEGICNEEKVLALLVTFVMMFTMVGCNAQGVELINELKTVSTWEAMETKSNLDLSFTYQGESFKANAEVVSYSNSKDLQMEATMTIKNVEFSLVKRLTLQKHHLKFHLLNSIWMV